MYLHRFPHFQKVNHFPGFRAFWQFDGESLMGAVQQNPVSGFGGIISGDQLPEPSLRSAPHSGRGRAQNHLNRIPFIERGSQFNPVFSDGKGSPVLILHHPIDIQFRSGKGIRRIDDGLAIGGQWGGPVDGHIHRNPLLTHSYVLFAIVRRFRNQIVEQSVIDGVNISPISDGSGAVDAGDPLQVMLYLLTVGVIIQISGRKNHFHLRNHPIEISPAADIQPHIYRQGAGGDGPLRVGLNTDALHIAQA